MPASNILLRLTEEEKTILSDALHLLEASEANIVKSWVQQAQAFTSCYKAEIHKKFGISFENFVFSQLHRDGARAQKIIKAYARIGEKNAKLLTYNQVERLLASPEETVDAILKDKTKLSEYATASKDEADKILRCNSSTKSGISSRKKDAQFISARISSSSGDRSLKKVIDKASQKATAEAGYIMEVQANSIKITSIIKRMIDVRKKIGPHKFEGVLGDDVANVLIEFISSSLEPRQLAAIAAKQSSNLLDLLEDQIKRGKEEINVSNLLKIYAPDMEKIRKALSNFDLLVKNASSGKIVSIESKRRANA